MITIENLKAFKETLDILQIELKELIKIRSEEKLFANAEQYYLALKACDYFPQDYFKLRIFDTEIELKFNNRIKKYYFHIDTLKYEFITKKYISDFLKKWKIKPDTSDKNFYINQDIKFNDIVKIFIEFLILFLQFYNSQDKLFYFPI